MKYFILLIFELLISCSTPTKNDVANGETTEKQNVFSRDDFETLFYGKPEDFVRRKLGSPGNTQELFAIDKVWWWYRSITFRSKDEARDEWVKIRFDQFSGGKVDKISYQ